MSTQGGHRKFRMKGSGRRRRTDHLASFLRLQCPILLPLGPSPVAMPNDHLVPVSVGTTAGGDRLQSLHTCPPVANVASRLHPVGHV
jgi:hypothetical protein